MKFARIYVRAEWVKVYLVQDTKILPADVTSDRQRMDRFVQETKAAAA